jgi:hypothetical protein
MWLLLETVPSSTDPIAIIAQYGFPGIILILVMSGWLWPKPAVDEIKRQCADEQAQYKADRELWVGQVLPLLKDNAVLLRTSVNEMAELSEMLRGGKKA